MGLKTLFIHSFFPDGGTNAAIIAGPVIAGLVVITVIVIIIILVKQGKCRRKPEIEGKAVWVYLTLYHTIPTFNDPKEEGFGKHRGKWRKCW